MGEKIPVRARFLAWLLLLWLFIFVWIGMGSVIVYSAFQDGQVVLGGGVALIYAALIVYLARAWYRASARRRALVAAWTWWQDSDVQDRPWRLITQPFKQPFADALPALEQATQQTPSDADAWVRLAETLSRVGRPEEALAASGRALALDPQLASALVRKASALVNLERAEKALAASEHALALDPEAASAWASKGAALEELGRDAEALDAYDRAVALGIERAAPWFPVTIGLTRCRLLARLGRYKEALQACNQVLAIQPNLALAWYFKATCLGAWGRRADRAEAAATLLHAKELAG
jgi:tetratricopeptide (TPR) repeat protein